MPLFLMPAYGRYYETEEQALEDWNGGKDFKIVSGPYTSVRDREVLVRDYGRIVLLWNWPNLQSAYEIT